MGTFFAICICIVVVIWVLKGASNKNHPDSDKQSFRERKTPLNTVYRSSNTSNRSEQSNVQQNFDYGKLWIPKNQRFQIDNYVINGGMIYVGSQPKINGYVYNLSRSYPTLIDPKLPIDSNNPDVNGTSLDYYPNAFCNIRNLLKNIQVII